MARNRTQLLCTFLLMTFAGCSISPNREALSVASVLETARPARVPTEAGVALAGGGTKAASYAMGVLAALADSDEGLAQVDAISSVSGGGYAAFFLYSKLLGRKYEPDTPDDPIDLKRNRRYFRDCLPSIYKDFLHDPNAAHPRLCASDSGVQPRSPADEEYRFQQFVRCRQDVLKNDCQFEQDGVSFSLDIANVVGLLAGTALAVVPNFFARTVFDWPLNLSPSRQAYMQGIGTTYGLYPRSIQAASAAATISCKDRGRQSLFFNCVDVGGAARLDTAGLDFPALQAATQADKVGRMPVWFINATASRSRSIIGWAGTGRRDFANYTMQMAPNIARSGFHGRVDNLAAHLDLLGGVTTAAAFLDSNQVAVAQPYRLLAAIGQHALAFDWGVDIPNPNVRGEWRVLHNILPTWPWPWTNLNGLPPLPIPWYFLDGGLRLSQKDIKDNQYSAYIRLLDGGNNDNLGAYTLIEAGMKDIFISDHAQDTNGEMEDLCLLHNEVRLRSRTKDEPQEIFHRKLVVPGLKDFARHCMSKISDSECDGKECAATPGVTGEPFDVRGGYPVQNWKHLVLLGCIRDSANADDTHCDGNILARVYVLKPGLNRKAFEKRYIAGGKANSEACGAGAYGTCEVAAYLARGMNKGEDDRETQDFPQHSTVGMTFASTGARFGAYRELARSQMREALSIKFAARMSPGSFAEQVRKQRDDCIVRVPISVTKDGIYPDCKSGNSG